MPCMHHEQALLFQDVPAFCLCRYVHFINALSVKYILQPVIQSLLILTSNQQSKKQNLKEAYTTSQTRKTSGHNWEMCPIYLPFWNVMN